MKNFKTFCELTQPVKSSEVYLAKSKYGNYVTFCFLSNNKKEVSFVGDIDVRFKNHSSYPVESVDFVDLDGKVCDKPMSLEYLLYAPEVFDCESSLRDDFFAKTKLENYDFDKLTFEIVRYIAQKYEMKQSKSKEYSM